MIQKFKLPLLTVLLGVTLTLCSFVTIAAHADSMNTAETKNVSCTASCHSHGQAAALNSRINEEDEDDKEPIPPPAFWAQTPVNLLLLYTVPILGVLWFTSRQRKILLISQLRF